MQSIIKAYKHLKTDPLLYLCPAITIGYGQEDAFYTNQHGVQVQEHLLYQRATVLYLGSYLL